MSAPAFGAATASRLLRERCRDDVAGTPGVNGIVVAVACAFAAERRPRDGLNLDLGISKHDCVALTCPLGHGW